MAISFGGGSENKYNTGASMTVQPTTTNGVDKTLSGMGLTRQGVGSSGFGNKANVQKFYDYAQGSGMSAADVDATFGWKPGQTAGYLQSQGIGALTGQKPAAAPTALKARAGTDMAWAGMAGGSSAANKGLDAALSGMGLSKEQVATGGFGSKANVQQFYDYAKGQGMTADQVDSAFGWQPGQTSSYLASQGYDALPSGQPHDFTMDEQFGRMGMTADQVSKEGLGSQANVEEFYNWAVRNGWSGEQIDNALGWNPGSADKYVQRSGRTKLDPTEQELGTGGLGLDRTGQGYQTVEDRMQEILESDNPYVQRARQQASEAAAERGLLNTSMAAQAGEAAAIDAAMDIAKQDSAQSYGWSTGARAQDYSAELETLSFDLKTQYQDIQNDFATKMKKTELTTSLYDSFNRSISTTLANDKLTAEQQKAGVDTLMAGLSEGISLINSLTGGSGNAQAGSTTGLTTGAQGVGLFGYGGTEGIVSDTGEFQAMETERLSQEARESSFVPASIEGISNIIDGTGRFPGMETPLSTRAGSYGTMYVKKKTGEVKEGPHKAEAVRTDQSTGYGSLYKIALDGKRGWSWGDSGLTTKAPEVIYARPEGWTEEDGMSNVDVYDMQGQPHVKLKLLGDGGRMGEMYAPVASTGGEMDDWSEYKLQETSRR